MNIYDLENMVYIVESWCIRAGVGYGYYILSLVDHFTRIYCNKLCHDGPTSVILVANSFLCSYYLPISDRYLCGLRFDVKANITKYFVIRTYTVCNQDPISYKIWINLFKGENQM